MASRLLVSPLRSRFGLSSALTAGALLSTPLLLQRNTLAYRLDTLSEPLSIQTPQSRPPSSRRSRPLNPRTVRQITTGSIIGVMGGLAVSMFSKPLAIVLGLLLFGVQFLETRGIHVVPYDRIQRYFKDIDVQRTLGENPAFRLSFGATFLLAAFASF